MMINKILINKQKKILLGNFFSLLSIKGIDFLIPLLIIPYIVRTLGLDVFGLISFSLSISIYFGAIIHYGYSIVAVRDISRIRNDKKKLSEKYSEFLTTTVFLIAISFIIFLTIIKFIPTLNNYSLLHIYTFYYIAMQSLFPAWLFQGIEKMKYIAYINVSTKILFLISLFVFVKNPEDYLLVPVLNGLSMMISTIFAFWLIKSYFKITFNFPKLVKIKNVIFKARHAFIVSFSPTLYNNTAMFILGFTTNNNVVGIYASATKLIDALNSIAILLSNTFLPYLSRNIKKHLLFSKIMIVIALSISLFSFIFSEKIVILLFSKENIIVSNYFKLLIPMVFFIFIRTIYGPNYLMLIGKESLYKKIILYTCLVFFIITFYVVPKFEINGAISVLLSTSFFMAALTFFYYKKHEK